MSDDLRDQLEALLRRTAKAYHQAYIKTDGYHPEWAEWYADYAGIDNPFLLQQRCRSVVTAGDQVNRITGHNFWHRAATVLLTQLSGASSLYLSN